MAKIGRTYRFEAAHRLPKVPPEHKCHRLHGHNYRIVVELHGDPIHDGMILDFFQLDAAVLPLVEQCDHRVLNDIYGMSNPTAELICQWFHLRIKTQVPMPVTVRVYENDDSYAEIS